MSSPLTLAWIIHGASQAGGEEPPEGLAGVGRGEVAADAGEELAYAAANLEQAQAEGAELEALRVRTERPAEPGTSSPGEV